MIARLLGVVQIVVGVAIWIRGASQGVVAFHAAAGSLFVLALWIIGVIALFALPRRGLALFTLLWGGLVLWFGMAQTTLLVGSAHWAIRVAHLLVGLAAMGLAEALGGATRRHWAATHES
ncbi:MAG TPA: hypothetical protein VHB25_10200 [Gemmatimonadaceae bacterium]|nr:hypothetical protein [Gemmatimonadaceae bacterium]